MSQLSRYISSVVSAAILLVLVLIVGLDMVAALIDQLSDLRGSYTFGQAMIYILLTVPGRIYEFIPMATLVGCLVAMGTLASNSELTVLRSSGVSVARLVWLGSRPAILLVIFSILISQYLTPFTDQWAKSHKDLLRWGDVRSLATEGGLWHREGDDFMHFNVVQPGGILYGVSIFSFDQQAALAKVIVADRASYTRGKWTLENVETQYFKQERLEKVRTIVQGWNTNLSPELLRYLALDAEELSISGLYEYANYLEGQALDSGEYRLAFWQKCLQPLAVLSLAIIALSFVFGPLRSSTMGFRVFVGVVVGIAFQFAQNLLGPSSLIYHFPPLLGILLPILLCFGVGFTLLYRAR